MGEPELPWYFPSPAEYTALLEEGGFTVRLWSTPSAPPA